MINPRNWFKTKSLGLTVTTIPTGFESNEDLNNLAVYKQSLYLNIAVSLVSKRVAGIPFELYKIKNKKGDVQEVFDHQLLNAINNPSTFLTKREFMELSVAYYLLSGDCFWLLDRNGSSITGIATLAPDKVEIILSADRKTIVAYEYKSSAIQRFKPEDVVHIKNIDPTNPLRGVGVVAPATSRILTELEATKYQANFFKNQGRPDFVIMTEGEVSEEQAAEGRANWKRVFGGKNSGNVGFFGGNVKSVQELTKSPKEMDFIETQKFLRTDILSALHVPHEMVTSDGSNRATSKEAYKMFLQEAVLPVFEAFEDAINNRLVPQFDISVFFSHTDPTPVDRELQLKEVSTLKDKGIITANEARTIYNYDAIEGGDTVSTTQAPVTSPEIQDQAKQFIRMRPMLSKRLDAIQDTLDLMMLSEPKRQLSSIFPDQASKDMYAKAFNKNVDKQIDKVKTELDKFHDGMLKRILKTDLDVNAFMDTQAEKRLAKDLFTPIMVKLYKDAGQSALDALFKKSADQFFTDAVLLRAIEGRVDFFTNSIVDTTFDIIKGQIIQGVAEGYSVDKIAGNIKSYFEDMSNHRAKTIAQTESVYVISKATHDSYMQSSIVTGEEWITVGDDRVREEHVGNDRIIVPKGAAFPNGENYPGEHSINCRCVLAPTI